MQDRTKKSNYKIALQRLSNFIEKNIDYFYFSSSDRGNTIIYDLQSGKPLGTVHKFLASEILDLLDELKAIAKYKRLTDKN